MKRTHELRGKSNDCVVCGAILYELGTKQCHTRPRLKVKCGTAGLPTTEV